MRRQTKQVNKFRAARQAGDKQAGQNTQSTNQAENQEQVQIAGMQVDKMTNWQRERSVAFLIPPFCATSPC